MDKASRAQRQDGGRPRPDGVCVGTGWGQGPEHQVGSILTFT